MCEACLIFIIFIFLFFLIVTAMSVYISIMSVVLSYDEQRLLNARNVCV